MIFLFNWQFSGSFSGCSGMSNRFPDSITAKTEPPIYSPSILPSGRSEYPTRSDQMEDYKKLDDENIRNIYYTWSSRICRKNGPEFTIGICDRCIHTVLMVIY